MVDDADLSAHNAQFAGSDDTRADTGAGDTPAIHEHRPVPIKDPVENGSRATQYCELRAGGTFIALEATKGMRPILLYAGPNLPGVEANELAMVFQMVDTFSPDSPSVEMERSRSEGSMASTISCRLMFFGALARW